MKTTKVIAGVVAAVVVVAAAWKVYDFGWLAGQASQNKTHAASAAKKEAARAAALAELRTRWNATPRAAEPVDLPVVGRTTFLWEGETFPHPTYKGGSYAAYAAFGRVLDQFLAEHGSWLAANDLLRPAVLPTAVGLGTARCSFAELTAEVAVTAARAERAALAAELEQARAEEGRWRDLARTALGTDHEGRSGSFLWTFQRAVGWRMAAEGRPLPALAGSGVASGYEDHGLAQARAAAVGWPAVAGDRAFDAWVK